jgi:Lrp/AsnC family transcriptional regulator, leucine-responsive regulatory protein
MDNTDLNIIKLLQKNARISASDISKKVNLSVSAVADRLRRLESSKTIKQYTTILNPEKSEKELSSFMLISLKNPNVNKSFTEFVASENDILSCFYIAGEFDYMINIVTKNTSTLTEILNRIKSIDGVAKTNTIVILDREKDHHSYIL